MTPPQPFAIEPLLSKLLLDYEEDLKHKHPLQVIPEFHLKFESIHPFIDGNGRTGRLIMNLELMKQGYLPIDIKYIDQEKYYDAFDHYNKTSDNFFMEELVWSYEQEELEAYLDLLKCKEATEKTDYEFEL